MGGMMKKMFQMKMLVWWSLLGVVVGALSGGLLYNANCSLLAIELIGYPGELFIRALQALVLPLVIFTLMAGVFSLRHTTIGIGRVTTWAMFFYLMTMLLAVALGITFVQLINPGKNKPFNSSSFSCTTKQAVNTTTVVTNSIVRPLLDIGRDLVPPNIVAAAAKPNYLGIITCAIIFAFTLNASGERAEPLMQLVELLNGIVIRIILVMVKLTPIGIASLVASTILKACDLMHLLQSLGLYLVTVIGGFAVHSFVVLPILVFALSRQNPITMIRSFFPALCLAFGTASTATTIPLAMQCSENHGCEKSIFQFMIPLGANVHRDGAALYEAVSAVFICQAHGIDLSVGKLFIVAITSILAAIGSASIPISALLAIVTVLQALDLPQLIGDVSILYAVDWLLGMLRAAVNVWGNSCACIVVDAWAKQCNIFNNANESPL